MRPAYRRRLLLILTIIFLTGCTPQNGQPAATPLPDNPAVVIQDLDITTGQTIFVPAYSEIHYASQDRTIELAVTLAVHNADFTYPIILTSVRYYNTDGQMVREYLSQPQQLGAMASADFFVDAGEQTGGVGTNFIVEWVAEQPVYEPVVEALMLSTSGTQGLSFTSPGRVISQIE
ncbi:MAG: DUF3124 domain-containing protein [Caldilineaceae bacterium]|nr:DUF3124 domain-containing protein [Caldilineaceae bacterium]